MFWVFGPIKCSKNFLQDTCFHLWKTITNHMQIKSLFSTIWPPGNAHVTLMKVPEIVKDMRQVLEFTVQIWLNVQKWKDAMFSCFHCCCENAFIFPWDHLKLILMQMSPDCCTGSYLLKQIVTQWKCSAHVVTSACADNAGQYWAEPQKTNDDNKLRGNIYSHMGMFIIADKGHDPQAIIIKEYKWSVSRYEIHICAIPVWF